MRRISNGPSKHPEFGVLLDRCISQGVYKSLKDYGVTVYRLDDIWPGEGKHIKDPQWIKYAAENGLVAITADARIMRNPLERAAIKNSGAKVFILANSELHPPVQSFYLGRHILTIARQSLQEQHGPMVWKIHKDDVRKLPPHSL